MNKALTSKLAIRAYPVCFVVFIPLNSLSSQFWNNTSFKGKVGIGYKRLEDKIK